MIVVRPIQTHDLDNLMDLAHAASPGMTTLPPDRDTLSRKIARSTQSIESAISEAGNESYLFVMEDTATGKLVGTAGVIAKLGEDDQFYSYKLNRQTQYNRQSNKKVAIETLHLTNHFEGFAEVATLFLMPEYRKNNNGKLLARSRYLFMREFRERFPDQVMADLRGYFDEDGRSPFWEALGKHFFDMSYAEADLFGALNGNQIIADLMPKHPIYINLLPKEAQEVIGRPNDDGRAALAMLEKEGFKCNGQYDIFDGAPSVDAYIDQLVTVNNSKQAVVSGNLSQATFDMTSETSSNTYLICAGDISAFRVCISSLEINEDGEVVLPPDTVEALQVKAGAKVRYSLL
ncbi:arginine N-succinyltransferase [Agarilytica rhodophyticola]|uniref:arginine N-succinyltransferase n=1 Tax=Agarilytica rhodophyticola TaxID=1737490 RepID=UPI001319DE3B|nr:arginine N-succinyltransferase [Agarilytica rhodophyticola]